MGWPDKHLGKNQAKFVECSLYIPGMLNLFEIENLMAEMAAKPTRFLKPSRSFLTAVAQPSFVDFFYGGNP